MKKLSKVALLFEAIRHNGFISKFPHIFRMVKAWKSGSYQLKLTSVIVPALVLVYILSPLDIIPDFIPFVGALDDLALLSFAIPLLIKEVDKFLAWEKESKTGIKTIDVEAK